MPNAEPQITTCPLLHRDRFIVVVNKPAGVLSHPNSARADAKTRVAFEGRYDMQHQCFESPAGKVWLIHRLDQDTSGVLLGALDERTAERCRTMFEEDAVKKRYLALVRGVLPASDVWMDHLATTRLSGRVRTTVFKGKPPNAELRYVARGHHPVQRLSLLDIELITGRTHQIRVQAASRQHPLVGDDVYGDFDMNRRLRQQLGARRLCLHARRLEFKHPASGFHTVIEAPLADDFAEVLRALSMKP
jgi:RluA family pseudouridine synthase